MFDIGFSELVLIALLALLVLGPKRLPEAARYAGRMVGRLRRFLTDVKTDFDKEIEGVSELEELRKLRDELNDTRRALQESSSKLIGDVSTADLGGSLPTIAPPTGETPPAEKTTTKKPRRPRKPRTPKAAKKNGRTERTNGSDGTSGSGS